MGIPRASDAHRFASEAQPSHAESNRSHGGLGSPSELAALPLPDAALPCGHTGSQGVSRRARPHLPESSVVRAMSPKKMRSAAESKHRGLETAAASESSSIDIIDSMTTPPRSAATGNKLIPGEELDPSVSAVHPQASRNPWVRRTTKTIVGVSSRGKRAEKLLRSREISQHHDDRRHLQAGHGKDRSRSGRIPLPPGFRGARRHDCRRTFAIRHMSEVVDRTASGGSSRVEDPRVYGRKRENSLRKERDGDWEHRHAAIEIQRSWRGYRSRREFWAEGGPWLDALAVRVQKRYRGWRGKIRGARVLEAKRRAAAVVITSLGRGYLGRAEARRLRLEKYNGAATLVQTLWRGRIARRWVAELTRLKMVRGATTIQAAWRGLATRRWFRWLDLIQDLEEEAIEDICRLHTRRARRGTCPSFPNGFEDRFCKAEPSAWIFQGALKSISSFDTISICSIASSGSSDGTSDVAVSPDKIMDRDWREVSTEQEGCPSLDDLTCREHGEGNLERSGPGSDGMRREELVADGDGSAYHHGAGCNSNNTQRNDGNDQAREGSKGALKVPESSQYGLEDDQERIALQFDENEEGKFIAYAHCLLAGSGVASSRVHPCLGAFTGSRPRSKHLYRDALEVFAEGLRRFPSSPWLLYGASVALQAAWATGTKGEAPNGRMLEASFILLERAWNLDPERQGYLEAEAYFVAAARLARKNKSGPCPDAPNTGEKNTRVARAMLHVALWNQAAHGNLKIDLKRREPEVVYRRTSRLYVRAMQLDANYELPEIPACHSVFSALFLEQGTQMSRRTLRLKLPPHASHGAVEAGNVTASTHPYGPSATQYKQKREDQHIPDIGTSSCSGDVTSSLPSSSKTRVARSIITAWRAGSKLLLRVKNEQDRGEGDTSKILSGGSEGQLLCREGAFVVVHEEEIQRLHMAAVEEQVLEGRPRDLLNNEEPLRLIVEYFIGKLVLLPALEGDRLRRFSNYDYGSFCGRHVAVVPSLERIREQAAEASASNNGAHVLQRSIRGLVVYQRSRLVYARLRKVMSSKRERGRQLLQEYVRRKQESDAASRVQASWKACRCRREFHKLKAAASVVHRHAKRLAVMRREAKAERIKLLGPEVFTVFRRGTAVSDVPLMLTVFRCGLNFKFVGEDQDTCSVYQGSCYESEVLDILHEYNRASEDGEKGCNQAVRGAPIRCSQHRKIASLLVSRLALVDALRAPTSELMGQHKVKTLVVGSSAYDPGPVSEDLPGTRRRQEKCAQDRDSSDSSRVTNNLEAPGILTVGPGRGRNLRDTRAMVSSSYARFLKRQEWWRDVKQHQALSRYHKQRQQTVSS